MLIKIKSNLDFEKTVSKIEEFLEEKDIELFYIADHKKNAVGADLELEDTKVLIFGNPKVGTMLMQDNPDISYELPLRISVIKEENEVYIIYKKPTELYKEYELSEKSKEILEKMNGIYEAIENSVK